MVKSCEKKILEYLKENLDKSVSIYDFVNILKNDRDDRKYSYQTIYTVLKTLELKGIIEFVKDTSKIRTRLLVKLKNN